MRDSIPDDIVQYTCPMKLTIINAINKNLSNAIFLLDAISAEMYCDTSVGPYYSSVGSHVRHILDFFDCIVVGLDNNDIDLTARKRDGILATDKEMAKRHIVSLQETLLSYRDVSTDYLVHVTDNLGQGNITVSYTLESILAHANSHAVHHYATIGYILHQIGWEEKIPGFGYNPTTPVNRGEGV